MTEVKIKDTNSNPAPLGLMGFGMTTVLLNVHNAGFIALGSMILAMGIFYGGISQVIAGIMEFKKGNTFGTTAFVSYGFFWITLVGIIVMPKLGLVEAVSPNEMGCFLSMWGIFTLYMYIASTNYNRATQFVFGSLTVLFFLLAIADFTGSEMIKKAAGYEGIICGFSAIYSAMAQVINESKGKKILPL